MRSQRKPGTQVLAQIADAQGWRTRIILVNTDLTNPAPITLKFWAEVPKPHQRSRRFPRAQAFVPRRPFATRYPRVGRALM